MPTASISIRGLAQFISGRTVTESGARWFRGTLRLVILTLFVAGSLWAQNVSFFGPRNFAAGGAVVGVAVGDLNGDGIPDVVGTVQAFERHAVAG